MARGRMISKDISLDEKVNALSDDSARLLFTWIIPHLDVEGRIYGEPEVIKSIVVPRLNWSAKRVAKYLTELESFGLLRRYPLNGNTYIFAPHFEKHQSGLRKDRESQSKIPPPPPELLQSNDGITPAQDKSKFKYKKKEKDIDLDDHILHPEKYLNPNTNWRRKGKNAGVNRINSDDPDKYIKGEYGHMVRR